MGHNRGATSDPWRMLVPVGRQSSEGGLHQLSRGHQQPRVTAYVNPL